MATESMALLGHQNTVVGRLVCRGAELREKWQQIPQETDILLSHSPPAGYGDITLRRGTNEGCEQLLDCIQNRVRPKYMVFGHIHEGYGSLTDGTTVYINASLCGFKRKVENPPVIFDLPLQEGYEK